MNRCKWVVKKEINFMATLGKFSSLLDDEIFGDSGDGGDSGGSYF